MELDQITPEQKFSNRICRDLLLAKRKRDAEAKAAKRQAAEDSKNLDVKPPFESSTPVKEEVFQKPEGSVEEDKKSTVVKKESPAIKKENEAESDSKVNISKRSFKNTGKRTVNAKAKREEDEETKVKAEPESDDDKKI